MPRRNQGRRAALADATIAVLAGRGVHGLSHRAVDREAGVPAGTTSNYFRSRDDLLEAAMHRMVDDQERWVRRLRADHPERLDRRRAIDILAAVVEDLVERHPARIVAMFELAMESTRRPRLGTAFAKLVESRLEFVLETHSGTALFNPFYNGILFTAMVAPRTLGGRTVTEVVRSYLEALLR